MHPRNKPHSQQQLLVNLSAANSLLDSSGVIVQLIELSHFFSVYSTRAEPLLLRVIVQLASSLMKGPLTRAEPFLRSANSQRTRLEPLQSDRLQRLNILDKLSQRTLLCIASRSTTKCLLDPLSVYYNQQFIRGAFPLQSDESPELIDPKSTSQS